MADTPPAAEGGKSSFGFLTRKIGPVPIWLIALGLVGGYYWWTHYGPGAKAATPAAGTQPQVVVVEGEPGPPGPPGPPLPREPRPRKKPPARKPPRKRPLPRLTGPPTVQRSPVAQPVTAAAPMTAGDIYGDSPTASPDGSTDDSGYPSAAQLEGAYVPAG